MAAFTLGARALVPGHRHKVLLCSDTGHPICRYVHIQETEHVPTAFKVCESHDAYVPCSIYLLNYCFQLFFYFLMLCSYMKHLRDTMDYGDRHL